MFIVTDVAVYFFLSFRSVRVLDMQLFCRQLLMCWITIHFDDRVVDLIDLKQRQARFEQNQQITANSGGAMSAIDIGMPPPLDGGMMGQSNGRMGVGHRDLGLGHGQGGMGRPGVRDRQREDFGSYADNKRPRRY